MEELQELQRLHHVASQVALSLESCNTTEEVVDTLQELKYKHFTWQADTCYVDGKKKPLGGACKIFDYWTRETVDDVIRVDYINGVVVVNNKSDAYLSSTAPLSKRVRTLIGRY